MPPRTILRCGIENYLRLMTEQVRLPDYYDLLGLAPTATVEQIHHAYRHLLSYWHPDKWVSRTEEAQRRAHEMTVQVINAGRVLLEAGKRARYDELRAEEEAELPSPSPVRAEAGVGEKGRVHRDALHQASLFEEGTPWTFPGWYESTIDPLHGDPALCHCKQCKAHRRPRGT